MALDPEKAVVTLHELQGLTADSLRELQRLMSDLRPSHLDDLGLPAALRWYAAKVEERYPLKVRVDITGKEQPISDAAKIATFRIIQEALNNAIRHAEANNAGISLNFADRGVAVSIRDDGRGFDMGRLRQDQSSSRPPLGLAGMQERAALLGGAVTILSRPGEGTSIEAFVPYRDEGEDKLDDATSPGG
jgi:two-component system sensor histidine kinase DegS